jgi:hypothetical protein
MTDAQDDTLAKWMSLLANKTSGQLNDAIYEWALPVRKERIKCLYGRLLKLTAWKSPNTGAAAKADQGRRSRVVGLVYERLLRGLFDGGVLSVEQNIRTTTSEIDLLLKVEPTAYALPMLDGAGTHVIGEAKCHAKAPSSELVNELRGFIDTHSATLAFLFVFCTSRQIAPDARQAIALHGAQGRYIVPIGRKQLERVIAGEPVCRVLSDQRVHAANATTKLSV